MPRIPASLGAAHRIRSTAFQDKRTLLEEKDGPPPPRPELALGRVPMQRCWSVPGPYANPHVPTSLLEHLFLPLHHSQASMRLK